MLFFMLQLISVLTMIPHAILIHLNQGSGTFLAKGAMKPTYFLL